MAFEIVQKIAVKCDGCGEKSTAGDNVQRAMIFASMNGWKVGKRHLCPACAHKPTKRKVRRVAAKGTP